jgi:hypothetical protein
MTADNDNPWFHLMVGQWWTPGIDLSIVNAAATKRQATSSSWQNFSDRLRQQLTGSLSADTQKGITADNLRDTVHWGAEQARDIAKTNDVISASHSSAHSFVSDLNSRLETIADQGKAEIDHIQQSKDLPAVKLGKIVDVVMQCQQDANTAAAPCTQNVFEAVQNILDQRGLQTNARQFARQHGIDTTRMLGSPPKETITQHVAGLLGDGGAAAAPAPDDSAHHLGGGMDYGSPIPALDGTTDGPHRYRDLSGSAATANSPAALQSVLPAPAAPPAATGTGLRGPAITMSGSSNSLPTNALIPSAVGSVPQTNALMAGWNPTLSQGAPASGALNTVPPVTSPVPPRSPTPTVSDLPASTIQAAADAPTVGAPPPPAPPVSSTTSQVIDSSAAYVAGPAATPASAAPPAGSLPSYGSDIRPATPIGSTPTMSSSPVTTPTGRSTYSPASAPVASSTATGGLSQPAVIRQPAGTPTRQPAPAPAPAPASIGEQSVAATAGGAAGGAVAAQTTSRARLQRTVDFVARQEPRLRWIAGDRADGTTVLTTDLASGWIPPRILIPSGATLLEPGDRRGNIEELLGRVETSAGYTPLHHLPEPDNQAEPLPTSLRPRHVPAVNDLGWELGQATNHRDGLPRMAHTIARAAFAGTGLIDVEIQLLDAHLDKLREHVIGSYPDDVDDAAVSNWQLLAAIDALAARDPIGANYHFAWFQALNRRS